MENSLENVSLGPGSTVGEKGKHLPRLPSDSLRFRPCRFVSPFSPNEEPGPWLGEFVCGYRGKPKNTSDYKLFPKSPRIYLNNRPHFLWVYRHDNPRRILGEQEKSL